MNFRKADSYLAEDDVEWKDIEEEITGDGQDLMLLLVLLLDVAIRRVIKV